MKRFEETYIFDLSKKASKITKYHVNIDLKLLQHLLTALLWNFHLLIELITRKKVCEGYFFSANFLVISGTIFYFDLIFLALDQFLHVLQHPSV